MGTCKLFWFRLLFIIIIIIIIIINMKNSKGY